MLLTHFSLFLFLQYRIYHRLQLKEEKHQNPPTQNTWAKTEGQRNRGLHYTQKHVSPLKIQVTIFTNDSILLSGTFHKLHGFCFLKNITWYKSTQECNTIKAIQNICRFTHISWLLKIFAEHICKKALYRVHATFYVHSQFAPTVDLIGTKMKHIQFPLVPKVLHQSYPRHSHSPCTAQTPIFRSPNSTVGPAIVTQTFTKLDQEAC